MALVPDIRKIPKIELHAHLSGSLSDATVSKLLKSLDNSSQDIAVEKEKYKLIVSQGPERCLQECFEVFKLIHLLTNNLQSVKTITENVIDEFFSDNVQYLELRTTPKAVPNSYSKRDYLKTILEVFKSKEKSLGIWLRLLISIDRSRGVADANENLLLVKEFTKNEEYSHFICGIDISGNPYNDNLINYIHILEEAKSAGLNVSAHLFEVNTETAYQEGKELINRKLVDRIGHATFLHPLSGGCPELTSIVKEKKIPIEICITSNVKCGTTDSYEEHHLKHWKAENHPIVICTDDKGVFSTSLSEEIESYMKIISGDVKDLREISINAINSSFLEKEKKDILKQKLETYFV